MGLQTEITEFIGETADKWDEYILTDKAPLGMISQFELAKQILAKMRKVVEGAGLTPRKIASLNGKWEDEYKDVVMTDAEWEVKRFSLIAQAQLQAILKAMED